MNGVAHYGLGRSESLDLSADRATTHCLTGCAAGEVLGMVIATALAWGNTASIAISVALAFLLGYAVTLGPILQAGVRFRRRARPTVASDTILIGTMELVDTAYLLVVPGAMAAGLSDGLFWCSLSVSLAIAFLVTAHVNRWLIARGRGHAVIHRPPFDSIARSRETAPDSCQMHVRSCGRKLALADRPPFPTGLLGRPLPIVASFEERPATFQLGARSEGGGRDAAHYGLGRPPTRPASVHAR